jgi:acetyl-CoA carboxylase biotin carboxyl carrier protein
LDLKEIRQIIELMKRHDLSLFHLERDGMKIKLKKGVDFDTLVNAVGHGGGGATGAGFHVNPSPGMRLDPMLPAANLPSDDVDDGSAAPGPVTGPTIDSPMVGTFYRCASPGDPPFAKEGDRVSDGQVICIIEAMKVMNEIKAETSGTIVKVLVNDGTPVQFGQALFQIKQG